MLKFLVISNIVLAIAIFVLFSTRQVGTEGGQGLGNGDALSSGERQSTSPDTRPASGGIDSQLGGGLPVSQPVVIEQGRSWHLPKGQLQIALYDAITTAHPPRLDAEMGADIGFDAQQRASINDSLAKATTALIACERAGREVRTDDQGRRFVYVAEYEEEAKRIFADLEAALAEISDMDRAAIFMIGVRNSIYFRHRGRSAKLIRAEQPNGQIMLEDWRGDWKHRLTGEIQSPFNGSYDHLIDLEELGWTVD